MRDVSALQVDVEPIAITEFQTLVLSAPTTVNLFLGGGKGGGKTFCEALLIADHINTHGAAARVLFFRQSPRRRSREPRAGRLAEESRRRLV